MLIFVIGECFFWLLPLVIAEKYELRKFRSDNSVQIVVCFFSCWCWRKMEINSCDFSFALDYDWWGIHRSRWRFEFLIIFFTSCRAVNSSAVEQSISGSWSRPNMFTVKRVRAAYSIEHISNTYQTIPDLSAILYRFRIWPRTMAALHFNLNTQSYNPMPRQSRKCWKWA